MLPVLNTGFSRGRSGGLVFPSLSEFPQLTVIYTVKGNSIVNKAEIDVRRRNAKRQNVCLRRPYKYLRKAEKLKAKAKKERYTHWNEEFQRIARRDKKAFLSDQSK